MKKITKLIVVFLILVILLILASTQTDITFQTYEALYLYDNDELITVSSDENTIDRINEIADESDGLKVEQSNSIVSFDEDTVDYEQISEDADIEFSPGYEYRIDDSISIYITDKDLFDKAFLNVLEIFLSDAAYQTYLSTGEIPPFTKDGKTYTDFYIDSDVEITKGQYPESVLVDNVEEIEYFLLNGTNTPEYDYIDEDTDFDDILRENDISENLIELNNPGIDNNTLFYLGQEIIVNEPQPVFKMVGFYETTETREIDYQEFEEPDDTMASGVTEVTQEGEKGKEELEYRNQEINGQIVSQTLLDNTVLVQPVNEITTVGTAVTTTTTDNSSSGEVITDTGDYEFVDGTGDFAWPAVCQTVTNGYYGYAGHDAIDIQCGYGSPVYAADNGVVTDSGYSAYGYGNYVKIDHGNGYQTLYGHMAQTPEVSVGDSVIRGQVIGYEGNTGNSTGHHLHYEIRYNDTKPYLNPLDFY